MKQVDPVTLTAVEKVLRLQNADIFKYATTEMLAYIGSIASEVNVAGGETIYAAGDPADAMFVVINGVVRLEKNGEEILTAIESQCFGAWALVDDGPRLMNALSVTGAGLLKITREDFSELLSDHEEMTPAIFKAFTERVKENATRAIGDSEILEAQKNILRVFV